MADARQYDISGIEKELATAVETERRRYATDEMKKRAILTAPSYDAFRNLVACANQKPVSQKDMEVLAGNAVKKFPPIRNAALQGVQSTTAAPSVGRSGLGRRRRRAGAPAQGASTPSTAPATSARSFLSAWAARPGAGDRLQLLQCTDPAAWQGWFEGKAEEGSVLGEMGVVLAEAPPPLRSAWVAVVMAALPAHKARVWGGMLPPEQGAAWGVCLAAQAAEADSEETRKCIEAYAAAAQVPLGP